MGDLYSEILVKKQPTSADTMKKAGLIGAVSLLVLGGIFISIYLLLLAVVAGVLIFVFVLPKLNVEYEYLLVNKELEIDAIYSKSKRKKQARYNLEEMELLAPLDSHRMDYHNGNEKMIVRDFSSQRSDVTPYAMIIRGNAGTEKVLLELERDIAENLRRTFPSRVYMD